MSQGPRSAPRILSLGALVNACCGPTAHAAYDTRRSSGRQRQRMAFTAWKKRQQALSDADVASVTDATHNADTVANVTAATNNSSAEVNADVADATNNTDTDTIVVGADAIADTADAQPPTSTQPIKSKRTRKSGRSRKRYNEWLRRQEALPSERIEKEIDEIEGKIAQLNRRKADLVAQLHEVSAREES